MPIYIAARDLAGFPVGTHQFIVIVNKESPYPPAHLGDRIIYSKSLGKGKTGYVVGAQNRGSLVVEYFQKSDYEATLEYFDKSRLKIYKSDFDPQLIEVKYKNISDDLAVKRILTLVNNYYINQSMDRIRYPTGGLGFNSNS